MSSLKKSLQSTIVKRATLTSEQITCIEDSVVTELDGSSNAACRNVASELRSLYTSSPSDVAESISRGQELFPVFCRPECGQVIINILDTCNAFDEVADVANLLAGMCALNGGRTCYSNFDELVQYVDNGEACYGTLSTTGTCSSQCSTLLADGVRRYGCCVNVPIDYEVAIFDVRGEINTLFSACGVSLPANCRNNPLFSASHTVEVAVNVSIIAIILAAWQLI